MILSKSRLISRLTWATLLCLIERIISQSFCKGYTTLLDREDYQSKFLQGLSSRLT
ncbi:hypothetical protein ACB098_06G005400 [Castanea mollissima]